MLPADRRSYNVAFLLLTLTGGAFAAAPFVLRYHFCADDFQLIWAALTNPFPLTEDFRGFGHGFFFRPFINLSLAINFAISGREPWSYFLFNVSIHALNAYLCSKVVVLLTQGRKELGVLAGLVFFLLPQGLINVFWISGRSDLLCSSGIMGALLLSQRYWKHGSISGFIFSLLAFVFGLMCKETAVLLIVYFLTCLVLSSHLGIEKDGRTRLLHVIIAGVLVLAAYSVFRFLSFGLWIGDQNPGGGMNGSRLVWWILHGIWSIAVPFDPIDIFAVWVRYPALAVILLLPVVGILTAMMISSRMVSREIRWKGIVLLGSSIVSLVIYARSFPQARLSYAILPLFVSAVSVWIGSVWNKARTVRIGFLFYIIGILASSSLLTMKYWMIGEFEKSVQEIDVKAHVSSDTLFVIAEIGRIGQAPVETSMPVRYHLNGLEEKNGKPLRSLILCGIFEGSIMTDWKHPYSITMKSDTLILQSSDQYSGFVPVSSKKYESNDSLIVGGITQTPSEFYSWRKGIAGRLILYPLTGVRAKVLFLDNGVFAELPMNKFKEKFSAPRASDTTKIQPGGFY